MISFLPGVRAIDGSARNFARNSDWYRFGVRFGPTLTKPDPATSSCTWHVTHPFAMKSRSPRSAAIAGLGGVAPAAIAGIGARAILLPKNPLLIVTVQFPSFGTTSVAV